MRIIKVRIPAKTVRSYQCETCKTRYSSKTKARECEKRVLEIRRSAVGDRVSNIEPRTCGTVGKGNINYHFDGIIIKVVGPNPADYEYEVRWLGAQDDRVNGHIYQYEVRYVCPVCNKLRTALYYAPELKSLKVEKKYQHKVR